MTNWQTFFKGKYLSAVLLMDDCTFVIGKIDAQDVENPDNNEVKSKMIIHWQGNILPWIPSKTACFCLEAMYGENIEGWIGKPITLYNDKGVRVAGKQTGGIRVRGAPGIKPVKIKVTLPKRKAETVELFDTTPRRI